MPGERRVAYMTFYTYRDIVLCAHNIANYKTMNIYPPSNITKIILNIYRTYAHILGRRREADPGYTGGLTQGW